MTAVLAVLNWLVFDKIGHYVGIALIVGAVALYGYEHIKGIGYAECKAAWTAAEQLAIKRGNDARSDAERDVTGGVRDDGRDRDNQ